MSERPDHLARLWILGWVVVGAWLVYQLSTVLTPFLLGLLLAYLGAPAVGRLAGWRIPRGPAAVMVLLGLVAVLAALVLLILPLVQAQASALALQAPAYMEWLRASLEPLMAKASGLRESLPTAEEMASLVQSRLGDAGSMAVGVIAWVGESGARLLSLLLNLLLVPVVAFYLLRDWDDLITRTHDLLPRHLETRVVDLVTESDRMLSGFLRGQLLVMSGLAVIYAVGLSILDVDYAIALGVIAGVFSFLPYVGTVLGLLLASLVAIVQTQDPWILAGVALVFALGQVIESTLLTPRLVGERIGLHPVLVIFAAMAGGTLFGFVGVLLALPAAAVLAVFVRHAHERYLTSEFYRGERTGHEQTGREQTEDG